MHVTVGAVALRDLSGEKTGDASRLIRQRVESARNLQRRRFAKMKGVTCNAFASGRWIDANGNVVSEGRELLQKAAERLRLSARGYHRVLKVARTIADLEGCAAIGPSHLAEALRYRPLVKSPDAAPNPGAVAHTTD
jgi:magnesium chelatase family protein